MNILKNVLTACLISTAPGVMSAGVEETLRDGELAYNRGDIVGAMSLFRKAAEEGHPTAQVRLARILDAAGDNTGAVRWFKQAAELGDAEASYELGTKYAFGEGVDKDLDTAVKLITDAAQGGYSQALRTLVLAYENGGLGLSVDHERAVSWLREGVARKDPWSIQRLAQSYEQGELGLPVNLDEAKNYRDMLSETATKPNP